MAEHFSKLEGGLTSDLQWGAEERGAGGKSPPAPPSLMVSSPGVQCRDQKWRHKVTEITTNDETTASLKV